MNEGGQTVAVVEEQVGERPQREDGEDGQMNDVVFEFGKLSLLVEPAVALHAGLPASGQPVSGAAGADQHE